MLRFQFSFFPLFGAFSCAIHLEDNSATSIANSEEDYTTQLKSTISPIHSMHLLKISFTSFVTLFSLLFFGSFINFFPLIEGDVLTFFEYIAEPLFKGTCRDLCVCWWDILIQPLFCGSFILINIVNINFPSLFTFLFLLEY